MAKSKARVCKATREGRDQQLDEAPQLGAFASTPGFPTGPSGWTIPAVDTGVPAGELGTAINVLFGHSIDAASIADAVADAMAKQIEEAYERAIEIIEKAPLRLSDHPFAAMIPSLANATANAWKRKLQDELVYCQSGEFREQLTHHFSSNAAATARWNRQKIDCIRWFADLENFIEQHLQVAVDSTLVTQAASAPTKQQASGASEPAAALGLSKGKSGRKPKFPKPLAEFAAEKLKDKPGLTPDKICRLYRRKYSVWASKNRGEPTEEQLRQAIRDNAKKKRALAS